MLCVLVLLMNRMHFKGKGTHLTPYLKITCCRAQCDDVSEDIFSENMTITPMLIWYLPNAAVIILNAHCPHITGITGNFLVKDHLHTGAAMVSSLHF